MQMIKAAARDFARFRRRCECNGVAGSCSVVGWHPTQLN